jgi:hypothetical protein
MGLITYQELRSRYQEHHRRINGISTPWGGLSWELAPDERKIAEEAVTYIENQGIFYAPFEWEHPRDTYRSADNARSEITGLMQKLLRRMDTFKQLELIRDALREFQRDLRRLQLDDVPSKSEMTNAQVTAYDSALTKLRRISGAQIGYFAALYQLDVSDELDTWLRPPADA